MSLQTKNRSHIKFFGKALADLLAYKKKSLLALSMNLIAHLVYEIFISHKGMIF
ncbi:hypothetical protein [Anaerococcus lactolyticus]|uniref:hypothetical protein n=1 Tax=Anaerococcus lactolyticus TaxID=33032 RepID=UPI0023F44ED6|nr:hypothetical protein [Anaerococcus lactolyticus]